MTKKVKPEGEVVEIIENEESNLSIFLNRSTEFREKIVKRQSQLQHELEEFETDLIEAQEAEGLLENDDLPELIVKSGQSRSIAQRTHRFKRVIIESGASLKILGRSRQWCIIDCEEEFVCHGTIHGKGIPNGAAPIDAVAPNGTHLTYIFPTNARGGRGGSGGGSVSNTRNDRERRASGGRGANGTLLYGGGGGGGGGAGFCAPCRSSEVQAGSDAMDELGGLGGQVGRTSGGDGGDGGRPNRNRNGVLLYIKAKSFDGSNGFIDLKGVNGDGGEEGGGGSRDTYSGSAEGNGGGSGGAPGGDGGVLVVEYNSLVAETRVNTQPGFGGPPGSPGSGRGNPGTRGRRGDEGEGGYADWIQM
jgi:hypothetical protein